jgi:calcineurin-like phosphoesterase family protein
MKIQITPKQNVFFCSDPHYHHKSLVKGTSNWADKSPCRDFATLEEHDTTLINNINFHVGENDILFCLGDWAFGRFQDSVEMAIEARNRINCKNIYFCFGNHDSKLRKEKELLDKMFVHYADYMEVYISEHTNEQGVKPEKQFITMSHYSIRSWNRMRHGSWNLYGHSHNNLPDYVVKGNVQKSMDVGFDCHPEFRPFSYLEIKEIMDNRKIFTEDHH